VRGITGLCTHIENARGTDANNDRYCSKEDTEPWRFGTMQTPGQRNDLHAAVDAIRDMPLRDVADLMPTTYIKYHRGIQNFKNLVAPPKQLDFKTEVHVLVGTMGAGKSLYAATAAKQDGGEVFYKTRGEWWDGYHQQEKVIMDDYYEWIKYDELLKICDRYPYSVPVKGGFEVFNSRKLWITSNQLIDQWYGFNGYTPDAIYRRVTTYKIVDSTSIKDHEEHQRILKENATTTPILMKEIQKMEDQMEAEALLTDSIKEEFMNNEWEDDFDPHALDHLTAQESQQLQQTGEFHTIPLQEIYQHQPDDTIEWFQYEQLNARTQYDNFTTQDVFGTYPATYHNVGWILMQNILLGDTGTCVYNFYSMYS